MKRKHIFSNVIFIFGVIILYSVTVPGEDCYVAPNICPNRNITFFLYTRENEDGMELNIHDPQELSEMLPSKGKEVKILIHGYDSNSNDDFNVGTRRALLIYEDYYTISVDWSPLSKRPCREQSSLNARAVGNCTANLINILTRDLKFSLESIHVLGFGLGGQCTAFISRNLKKGNITRISAMDPTLEYFNTMDLSQRLDSSDAIFIDVYHTAAGKRGQIVPSGTIDSYFNGGTDQPGCESGDSDAENPHLCSHLRSFKYFVESINSRREFFGRMCEFNNTLPLKDCSEVAVRMVGFHVLYGAYGVFGVETASKPPFGLGPQVEFPANNVLKIF